MSDLQFANAILGGALDSKGIGVITPQDPFQGNEGPDLERYGVMPGVTIGQVRAQSETEPDPADYGITLGTNSCLDQCWEDFRQCLRNTNFPDQFIAQLSACQQACGG